MGVILRGPNVPAGAPPPPRYLGQDTTGDAYARASEAPLATRWPPRLKRRCPCQAEIGQKQTVGTSAQVAWKQPFARPFSATCWRRTTDAATAHAETQR